MIEKFMSNQIENIDRILKNKTKNKNNKIRKIRKNIKK